MKARIYLLILLFFSFEQLSAQTSGSEDWFWQYPKPQGNTLNDIFIFNRDTAIAAGDFGTVIKTTNSGDSWSVQHHIAGTSQNLSDVYFLDELRGWAAGGTVLLKTEDGGDSWTEIKTNTPLGLRAVHFVDADTGIVVGEEGIVLRTTDGGNSWDIRKIDDYIGYGWLDVFDLNAITFTDKQTGWIVGAGYYGNQIYKTTDCGRTWKWNEQIVQPKIFSSLYDICFTDKNNGFIVGDEGVFLKTSDGGTTWQCLNLSEKYQKEEYQYFYSLFFTDSLTGWIVGGDYYAFILKTSDGGENWTEEENNEIVGHFYKVRYTDVIADNTGWIVGQFGMIYRTTDAGGSWISQREENYGFNSIYFVNENTGWAVGDSGIILHTTNGGGNWQKQIVDDSMLLSSVYAIDNQNVFAVGSLIKGNWPSFTSNGIILKTNDCGQTWTRQSFDTLSEFRSVIFINDSIGWITVTNGTLLKTTNKGTTWERFSSGLGTILSNIQFIDDSIGWVSFYGGNTLLKTVDGGRNWNSQFIDSSLSMYSFYFVNANMGWAVGQYYLCKNIFKTTDGGKNWTPCINSPIANYNSVYFFNETTGWAAGSDYLNQKSSIIKTTNGGNTWIGQDIPSKSLTSLFFMNENIGWAIGDGIFKQQTAAV